MDKEIEYFGQLITEDSIIRLTDGREIKGKYEITKEILECCKVYTQEYVNNSENKFLNKACQSFITSSMIVTGGLLVYEGYKFIKKKQSEK